MAESKKQRKISSNQSNSGWTSKLTDRDRHVLKRIVGSKHKTTAAKVTAELSQNIIVQLRPKLFSVISIKPDIMENRPSRNLCFPQTIFRRGSSDVVFTRAGLQTTGSM